MPVKIECEGKKGKSTNSVTRPAPRPKPVPSELLCKLILFDCPDSVELCLMGPLGGGWRAGPPPPD